jgi:D-alanyl-D-alanine carboxypeptidase
MEAILDRFVDRGIVGVSAAVRVPGEPVITAVAGVANQETGERVSPDHLFKIGSCTKTFVAATLVSLAADGLVSLDSSIAEWFPELPGAELLTVHHLINHRSGLPEYEHDIPMGADETWSPSEIINLAFQVGQQNAPDQKASYSNTGYVLAGALIEQLTSNSLSHQIRQRVTGPLELRDTFSLADPDFPSARLARGYFSHPHSTAAIGSTLSEGAAMWSMEGVLDYSDELQDSTGLFSSSALYAAGDMAASAVDVACFLDGLFSERVLDAQWLDAVTGDRWPAEFPGTRMRESGAGVFLANYGNRQLLGHQGSVPGYVSLMQHDPASGVSYALLTNTGSGNRTSFEASGLHGAMDEIVAALNE